MSEDTEQIAPLEAKLDAILEYLNKPRKMPSLAEGLPVAET